MLLGNLFAPWALFCPVISKSHMNDPCISTSD
jgi:hypothetical protein